jgi:DNA repair photolyase
MVIREIEARSILSRSKVFDYTVNPYVGCQHGCTYCYARFMKRFTGHKEPWGEFVDVKINAPQLLLRQIQRVPRGRVWISGMCDPYQPLEGRYQMTRKCLEILVDYGWPLTVQTKSPLVLRDLELLKKARNVEVGLTVTTADEGIRKLFEPSAPPIRERINALEKVHLSGIRTYAMIAPILPGVEQIAVHLEGKVDYVLIDKMNYHYADWVYRRHGLEKAGTDSFFTSKARELASIMAKKHIECQILF